MYVSVLVCVYLCVYGYIRVWTLERWKFSVFIPVYVSVLVFVCVCVYMCVYMYVWTLGK